MTRSQNTKARKGSQDISSVLHEERSFPASAEFAARARIGPKQLEALHRRAREDHVAFWGELAERNVRWHKPFTQVLDASTAPNYRWFSDGELNVCFNCLDVHLPERAEKLAIIAETEAGEVRRLTYRQLHE